MKRLIPITAFSVLLIAAGGGLPPLVDAAKNSDSAAIRATSSSAFISAADTPRCRYSLLIRTSRRLRSTFRLRITCGCRGLSIFPGPA